MQNNALLAACCLRCWRKMRSPLPTLLFAAFLFACTPSPVRQQLNRAEEMMETDFRAASAVLDSIDSSALRGEEQALYAILRTQADYKGYKPITDSLPLIATSYYGIPSHKHLHAAMAWYSLGCYYSAVPTDSLAIIAYLNALDLFPDSTTRYYRLSLQNLGQHYLNKIMLGNATTAFERYYNLAERVNDKRDISYANYFLGYAHLLMRDYATADSLFTEVLQSPPTNRLLGYSLLHRAKIQLFYGKDYEAALELLAKYRELLNNDSIFGDGFGYMGSCYQNLNQLDSALYYFNKAKQVSTDVYSDYRAYRGLTEVSLLKKEETEIFDYFDKFQAAGDSIIKDRDTQRISSLGIAHELENRKKEYKSNLKTMGFALLLLLVILYLLADRRRKAERLKYEKELEDIKRRYIQENVREGDAEEEESSDVDKDTEEREENAFPLPPRFSIQQERISLYRQQYAKSKWARYFGQHHQEIKSGKKYMALDDSDEFLSFLNVLFTDVFLDMLNDNPSLTRQDMEYCAMIMLGFETNQVSYSSRSSVQSCYTRRYRLRERLRKEWYQLIFSPTT
ncbi:MAG: hypothetical protein IK000_02385 [Bacteroidaceae bacterium]|nr:hypothetical protein [Bacteroidaceae bacterium]